MKSEIFLAVISFWMNSHLGWMNRLHSNSKSSKLCVHPFSCLEKRWKFANSSQHWGSTKDLSEKICLWTVNRGNGRFINSLALCFSVSEITSFISTGVCSAELSAAATLRFGHSDQVMSFLYICCFFSMGVRLFLLKHLLDVLLCAFLSQNKTKTQQVYLCC